MKHLGVGLLAGFGCAFLTVLVGYVVAFSIGPIRGDGWAIGAVVLAPYVLFSATALVALVSWLCARAARSRGSGRHGKGA